MDCRRFILPHSQSAEVVQARWPVSGLGGSGAATQPGVAGGPLVLSSGDLVLSNMLIEANEELLSFPLLITCIVVGAVG